MCQNLSLGGRRKDYFYFLFFERLCITALLEQEDVLKKLKLSAWLNFLITCAKEQEKDFGVSRRSLRVWWEEREGLCLVSVPINTSCACRRLPWDTGHGDEGRGPDGHCWPHGENVHRETTSWWIPSEWPRLWRWGSRIHTSTTQDTQP